MNTTPQSKKSGSALVLVLFAVVILSIMGLGLLTLAQNSRIFAIRTASDIKARCAADAGLTKALFEMNKQLKVKPWSDDYLPEAVDEILLSNDNTTFTYTVTGNVSDGYVIESTGKSGHTEKTVRSVLQLQGAFECPIFTEDSIDLKNGTIVDWLNFTEEDGNLKIGTNSTEEAAVDAKMGVTINGDVAVGFGGDPDTVISASHATITGDSYALTERQVLTPVTVPEWLESTLSAGTIENDTTIAVSGKYDEINLGNSETIIIDGEVTLYIIGDITLGNSAELQVVDGTTNPNASLIIYIGGDFEGKNESSINNMTEDATKVKIYGLDSCESMLFKNSCDLYGAIYAPNADVIFYNSANAFGSVVAESFEQKNSATFTYDALLRNVSINDEGVRFVIKQWNEW